MPFRFLFDPPRHREAARARARATAVRRKRQIVMSVVGAGVLAPVTIIARRHSLHKAALAEWTASASVILRLTGTGARAWIAEREGDVHLLTSSAAKRPPIFAGSAGQPQIARSQLEAELASALSQLRRSHGEQYTRIWVFDVAGRVVGSSDGDALSPSPAVQSVARASLGVDSVLVSQIYTRADHSAGLAFAERVVSRAPGNRRSVTKAMRPDSAVQGALDGPILGSIVLVIEPRVVLFPALDGGSISEKGEATALLMPHGDSVFEYDLTTHKAATAAPRVERSRALPLFEQAALGRAADGRGGRIRAGLAGAVDWVQAPQPAIDRRSRISPKEVEAVVELVRPVPGVDWAVVRRARSAAVFAAADAELVSECALALVVAVLAGWGVLFRSRSLEARRAQALAESERRLRGALEFVRAMVESSPVAIIAMDLDGTVTLWNGAAERLFGWTAAEVVGKPYPLVQGELWAEMERHNEETLARGHLTDVQLQRRRKDGTLLDVSLSTGVIHGPGGAPVGILALLSDLSERAKLEAQLRQAQKMEAVGQLAGGIAHDFNNLLTVITSYASLLLEDLPEDSGMHDDVTEIRAAARRAAGLTGQLLAFSRQQVFNPHAVDVNDLVTTMKQMLRRVLPANIELRTVLVPDLACVHADEGQLGQVLMNLVVNARDAIGDGPGTITIATSATSASPARDGSGPANEVVIAVTDTGCGMPDHVRERIFEPFYTTKAVGEGTGLGLSTVHGIIAQSGGRITVESELRRGSTFMLHLPALVEDSAHEEAPHPEHVSPTVAVPSTAAPDNAGDTLHATPPSTVLLVEDEAHVRAALARMLTRAGLRVIAAADATEALTLYEHHASTIDLVLTDMAMPGLTGAELVARLRGVGSDVPVLFMSGHIARGPLTESVLSDPSRFIQKPFTPDALTRKVHELIAQRLAMSGAWRVPLATLTGRTSASKPPATPQTSS